MWLTGCITVTRETEPTTTVTTTETRSSTIVPATSTTVERTVSRVTPPICTGRTSRGKTELRRVDLKGSWIS
jgi:hypothetical protein